MISEEMKHTEHYRMYAEVFGLDVPLTRSQPTECTQGTHRTPSAPRSPNPKMEIAESSASKRSIVIRFRLLERRSTRLTSPALVPTVDKADEMILEDTLQVSLAEYKSREEQEDREIVELVKEHLASIEKMVEGLENVIDDSLLPRNDEPKIPGTRLEPKSDKESPEVEITNDKEVEITNDEEVEFTNVVIPVNVNEEEEEITDKVYELKRREKGKIVEESKSTPLSTPIRSPRIHTDLDIEKLQEYCWLNFILKQDIQAVSIDVDLHYSNCTRATDFYIVQAKRLGSDDLKFRIVLWFAEGLEHSVRDKRPYERDGSTDSDCLKRRNSALKGQKTSLSVLRALCCVECVISLDKSMKRKRGPFNFKDNQEPKQMIMIFGLTSLNASDDE
ncbi:hypothetical protein Tco_0711830 [Tanacetum coccineum]